MKTQVKLWVYQSWVGFYLAKYWGFWIKFSKAELESNKQIKKAILRRVSEIKHKFGDNTIVTTELAQQNGISIYYQLPDNDNKTRYFTIYLGAFPKSRHYKRNCYLCLTIIFATLLLISTLLIVTRR